MIFRRIKAHIEKENWFAVFIDFLIVVVGVFIGIQVANWNEARVDRDREVLILERLEADFRQIETDSLAAINQTRYSLSVIEKLLSDRETTDQIFGAKLTPEDVEAIAFFKSPLRGSSTYDELKSAGELRFIRSELLRSELADFERTRIIHASTDSNFVETRYRLAPNITRILEIIYAAHETNNEDAKISLMALVQNKLDVEKMHEELARLLNQYQTVEYWHALTLSDARQVLTALEGQGAKTK